MVNLTLINVAGTIYLFFIADVLATYLFMFFYKKAFPRRKDWIDMEFNQIVKMYWKKYGLDKGSLLAFFTLLPIISFIIFWIYSTGDDFYFGVVVGMYFLLMIVHYINFLNLKKWKSAKKTKIMKKKK